MRFCATRMPVLPESWWKRTVLRSIALYSFTGTVTRPKLIVPDQIARGMPHYYHVTARAMQDLARAARAGRR